VSPVSEERRQALWHTALSLVALCLAASGCAAPRAPSERVLSLHADIKVGTDGALDVRETIIVLAAGEKFRRGVVRRFPLARTDSRGNPQRIAYEIKEVERDGLPSPSFRQSDADAMTLYLGDKEAPLAAGEHTYAVAYRTTPLVERINAQEGFHWIVTGYQWPVPIDAASATVQLPRRIRRAGLVMEGWTGMLGSPGSDYRVDIEDDGRIAFVVARRLGIGEGFTIRLAWPAGSLIGLAGSSTPAGANPVVGE